MRERQIIFKLLLLYCLLFPTVIISQTIVDTILARQYNELGIKYFYAGQVDSSRYFLNESKQIYKSVAIWDKALQNVNWMAYIFNSTNQLDRLETLFSSNQHIADSLKKVDYQNSILIGYLNQAAAYYDKKSDHIQKLRCDKEALFIQEKQAEKDSSKITILYTNIAVSYGNIGDHYMALDYALQALSFFNDREENTMTKKYLSLLCTIAGQYFYLNQYSKARFYYEQALTIIQKSPSIEAQNKTTHSEINSFLATIYLEQNEFALAEKHLQKAIQILANSKNPSPSRLPIFLRNFGILYHKKGEVQKAIPYFQEALDSCLVRFGHQSNYTSGIYKAFGDLYEQKPEQALSYYQKALTALVVDFNDSTNIRQNPTVDQLCFSKQRLFEILAAKAKALKQIGKLELGLNTYQRAFEVLEDLRQNYVAEGSIFLLQEKNNTLIEEAIQLATQLDQKELALSFAEKNKAVILQKVLQDAKAKNLASIPDSLLSLEQELKINKAFLEREIYTAQQKDDHKKIKLYKNQLAETKISFHQLKEELEKSYTSYYQNKYQQNKIELATIQNELKNEQAIIEYFFGEKNIYTFFIDKTTIEILSHPNNGSLNKTIQLFTNNLKTPSTTAADFFQFSTTATQLYEVLVRPALEHSSNDIKELTIIPDGAIAYIPFQALTKYSATEPFEEARFDTLHYLVNDFCFNYSYSISLAHSYQKRATTFDNNFVGFAPSFPEQDSLAPLASSLEEVGDISILLNGLMYNRNNATKEAFLKNTSQNKIIHLSTHAAIDDSYPLNSKIYFSDDYLTISEIYALVINARLVVLSACETGTGDLQKGEGLMSMARSFLYAGCPSIVTSLWQVNENSTKDLMLDFYTHLNEGEQQTTALQLAQQGALSETISYTYAHPYYWAAFIHIGEEDVLFDNRSWSFLFIFGIAGLLIFGLLFMNHIRNSRNI